MRMARIGFCTLRIAPLLFRGAWGQLPVCPEVSVPPGSGTYDVIYAQAPLEEEKMTSLPGKLINAYRTAVVFQSQRGPESFSLDFEPIDFMSALVPIIHPPTGLNSDISDLDWSGGKVSYCFSTGILNGKAYWTKLWKVIAEVTAEQLIDLLDFLEPWRTSIPFTYQMFQVETGDNEPVLQDLSCSQGALFAIDHLNRSLGVPLRTLGVPLTAAELPITTIHLLVSSLEEVGPESYPDVLNFYKDIIEAESRNVTRLSRIEGLFGSAQDAKFLHLSNAGGDHYYKLELRLPYIYTNYGTRTDWLGAFPTGWTGDDISTTPTGCQVLAGTQGKVIQCILFVTVCSLLVYKYHRNKGGRTFAEFVMDSSKQLFGAGWIHVMNLLFAQRLESYFEGSGDQCEWYWVNIVVDCTLGVIVEYLLLAIFAVVLPAVLPDQAEDFKSGEYQVGDSDSVDVTKYIKQLILWLIIVSIMKLSMVLFMAAGHVQLLSVAQSFLAPFSSSNTSKLMVVMVITPLFMNALQFWVTDNIIRKHGGEGHSLLADVEMEGGMRTRIDHGDL